ncbi:MAG: ATP-binding protein, partial [Bacteroidota bacterium]
LYEHGPDESLDVSNLFFDQREDRLWIGTNSGDIFFYDTNDQDLSASGIRNLPNQPVLAMEANTDSTVLVGFDGQGLWTLDRSGEDVLEINREDLDNPHSISGNGVYDIHTTRDKRVWVCTYSGGVSFFEQTKSPITQIKHRINDDNSLINNTVNDVFEDQRGNVWFATNNGISRWEVQGNKWTSFYARETGQARVFLSVYEDSSGNIWAGTWSEGVFVLDGETGQQIAHYGPHDEDESHIGDFIFDTTEDSGGDIWIVGVVENIVRYEKERDQFFEYSAHPVYTIEELNAEEILLGCSYGLVLLNKDNKITETLLEGYIIHDILIEGKNVWCATSGGGLIRYDMETREHKKYDTSYGLPTNFVNSLSYADGYLWLGTENGLCRFYPDEEEVLTYSSIIALSNVSFNQDAICKLENGKFIWGTNDGAIMFNPELLEPRDPDGEIFFQDLVVSGKTIRDSAIFDLEKPLNDLEDVSLSYNQNTITLELLPIGISSSESKFSWKMEGIDENWSEPSSNQFLTFANLPGGTFDLKIRLYNNSMSQIVDERQLIIEITPPFWRTWWFYLGIALFVAVILYFSFRYHINLIQQLHSEEKIRFFANTAHEIRTSLTLITAPVDELIKESRLSEQGKYYLDIAREQIRNLSKVATQLLDFQKFDKGREQLNLKTIDVKELVEHRKLMFESYARRKDLTITFHSDSDKCLAAIDVGMMEKVIDNLISNAVKYSHQGGEVFIFLSSNKNNWILEVKDQGIGISPQGQKQLFKEFYRSENAVNSEIVGSGIGLLVAKNYVEKHGGRINCESRENAGSTFKIEIPLRKEMVDTNQVDDAKGLITEPDSFMSDELKDELKKDREGKDKPGILVVEDNENLRHFMETALGDDFHVYSAANGKKGWEIVKNQLPELVVSDILMPEMDGFELCQLMKSTYETSHIPLILLTALTEKAEQLHGIGLGADAYVTKPFDMGLLVSRIKSIISNRKIIRGKALKLIDHQNDAPLMENELNDKFVKKALDVVKQNISNPRFGKEEFAFEMNVSPSLLFKKMKSLTGQSPTDFMKSVKLNYALELLQSGQYSVTDVSEKAGFSSVGYFSTVFKKFYRKSPTDVMPRHE